MKLKRKYARLTLILLGMCLVSIFLTYVGRGEIAFSGTFLVLTLLFFAAMAFVRIHYLKCPYCRKGLAVPHWSPWAEKQYCPKCGQQFVFDDEADIPNK